MPDAIDLVKLKPLMKRSRGSSSVRIAVIDGPVDLEHPALEPSRTKIITRSSQCVKKSPACIHGTFVAGILYSKRNSEAPAICPDCEIILCPILGGHNNTTFSYSTPKDLSRAIMEAVDAGCRIINLSVGLWSYSSYRQLIDSCNYARLHRVIVVMAVGNQQGVGNVPVLKDPWIIPVAACDEKGGPVIDSNYGATIGTRGLMAPGVNIRSTAPGGGYACMSGTSVAAPFVTGTFALLLSIFPQASAELVTYCVKTAASCTRRSIIPPVLNAEEAMKLLRQSI